MRYRRLGRSALQVSELCLGTMNFGPRTSESDSFAILNTAVEAGVNFIDTANQDGGELGVGTTETILGKWLAQNPSRRDRLVLATKVHEPMSEDINDRGLSARHIQMASSLNDATGAPTIPSISVCAQEMTNVPSGLAIMFIYLPQVLFIIC